MTPRERILAVVLGGFVVAAVAGFGGYTLFYSPIQARQRTADAFQKEIADRQDRLTKLKRDLPRLAEAKRRSLPADPDLARREYEAVLGRTLRAARVPAGATVTPRTVDNRNVPTLAPKKPAYTRVAFEVNFKKADLQSLVDFLEAYYKLNVLHQITSLTIKRPDSAGSADDGTTPIATQPPGRRGRPTTAGTRADLEVTLVTEAVILDVAEPRRTLLPVSSAFAAAGGYAAFHALTQSPEAGRGLTPMQFAPVLAVAGREYGSVVGKDLFHGPVPPPPVVQKEPEPPPAPPPPPKEDVSPYIRLTGITLRSDGSSGAEVRDTANNLKYVIELKPGRTAIEKYYFLKDRPRRDYDYPDRTLLTISDDSSATNRTFKVLFMEAEEMILADAEKKPTGPAAATVAAVGGGPAVTAVRPPDLYRWKVGQTLKDVKRLDKSAAREVILRLSGTDAGTPVALR